MKKYIGLEYTADGMRAIKHQLRKEGISYRTRRDGVIEYVSAEHTPSASILIDRAFQTR